MKYLILGRNILYDQEQAVSDAFDKLSNIIASEDMAAILERKVVILQMVLKLFKSSVNSACSQYYNDRIAQAVSFIQKSSAIEISISELALKHNFSVTHFRRLFKDYTGRSPQKFKIAIQMSRAKELLSEGRNVKQVASLLGYDDIFYFMRVFKRTTGMPPGKFAKMRI